MSKCSPPEFKKLSLAKESFLNSGGEHFDMVPCLNDNDDHIILLKSLIERNI